ncbi:glycine--tRNA ligase subunit beta [Succiniclasticum ruminis]|uniref:Glycine--tRNA ligase beta subunit n=1 Tax=Succiniclasticum ruminis DSM 9236 TaxID=1123323 RepID=A0A1I2ALC2_9FIRM|nr:glycine--tRNA ligase subunit beta [Succiniclasticum ruminis]SFE44702.1 glycyl-tRNA synthetase beta chain [Succiniclasticum ruminis DSM 9236]
MKKLLFEIGTEELPANYMPNILKDLKTLSLKKLQDARVPFADVTVLGTPRRLAVLVSGVEETQADSTEEFKGPAVNIAFKDGEPTKAAQGFARGKGVDVKDLVVKDNYIYAVKHIQGRATAELLPHVLQEILTNIPFPNHMRWADFDFRFLRPIRWLVALFGTEVVPVSITDIRSDRYTMGHRFLSNKQIEIPVADDYVKILEENFVIADQDKRREMIRQQITELAREEGGEIEIAADLLEEVNYLVEYPTPLCGKFEDKYLALPEAAIITPMRDHQRYFPVRGKDGRLLNKFIAVRNGGKAFLENVTHGNERVLRARLSDAEFFFNEDRKQKLETYEEKIKTVVFQEGLGNMYDKSQRLEKLVEMIHFGQQSRVPLDDLKRAARLSKCDLVTGMVTEFTELQGVMGREYARLDGEKADVCEGIFEQYLPRFAGDILPKTEIGQILSIADKVDNIVATFSRGKAPTGSQDPFALRRQALGIINILLDSQKHMDMAKVVGASILLLKVPMEEVKELATQIIEFIRLRFRNLLLDQKIRYDVIDAVLAEERNNDLYDLYLRAQALNEYVAGDKAADMIQAATRVNNLSSKAEVEVPINDGLFTEQAEKDLYAVVKKLDTEMIPLTVRCDYKGALNILSELNAPVNKFFDDVMVMDKDEAIKNNRLSLLCLVKDLVNCVGDLSKLVM